MQKFVHLQTIINSFIHFKTSCYHKFSSMRLQGNHAHTLTTAHFRIMYMFYLPVTGRNWLHVLQTLMLINVFLYVHACVTHTNGVFAWDLLCKFQCVSTGLEIQEEQKKNCLIVKTFQTLTREFRIWPNQHYPTIPINLPIEVQKSSAKQPRGGLEENKFDNLSWLSVNLLKGKFRV